MSESGNDRSELSHVDAAGRARMVDVSEKKITARTATARGELRCKRETVAEVRTGTAPKGAVISTAEIAGIMAAKRTAELIPLCHPLPLTKVAVRIELDDSIPGFHVRSEVKTNGATGVEMEALTAVSTACLTLFDMLKGLDRTMAIGGIEVTSKSGGKSGDWYSEEANPPATDTTRESAVASERTQDPASAQKSSCGAKNLDR